MSAAVTDTYSDCLYNICHKKLSPSVKTIICGRCKSECHWYCAKNCFKLHREQSYCRDCLKQKDLIRYNPYFEVNSHDDDDNEKAHFHNTISSSAREILSPLSDILEKCTINKVHTFNNKSLPMNSHIFQFLNIDGNTSNFDTFAATLSAISNKFSVIGLAETNVTCSLKDTFKLAGYDSTYQDAIAGKKKGSGVALYIRHNMNFTQLPVPEYCLNSKDIESLFVSLRNEGQTFTVDIIYRPPNGDMSTFIKWMSEVLESPSDRKHNTIIMGDFNINMFNENKISSSFDDIILCNGFTRQFLLSHTLKQVVNVRA